MDSHASNGGDAPGTPKTLRQKADITTYSDHSMIHSDNRRVVKEIVTTLVQKHKTFNVRWDDTFGWTIWVDEINEVGGLAGRWADA